jgi:hypothetical protein
LRRRSFAGWKTGVGDDVHFKIVDWQQRSRGAEPAVDVLPTVVFFVEGKEVSRITGYGGSPNELDAILNKHPKVKKTTAVRERTVAPFSGSCCGCCGCTACNCRPGANCGCLQAMRFADAGPSIALGPPVTVVDDVAEPFAFVSTPPPRLLAPRASGAPFEFGVNFAAGRR